MQLLAAIQPQNQMNTPTGALLQSQSFRNNNSISLLPLAPTQQWPNQLQLPNSQNPAALLVPTSSEVVLPSRSSEQPQEGDPNFLRQDTMRYQQRIFEKYDSRSLFVFDIRWRLRQYVIRLVRWKYFDYFMIASIAGNSVLLAITDYTDDDNLTKWNKRLEDIDRGFTVVFILEAVLKITAFGFVIHKRSYLRDAWNVLDFTVVIIGLISMLPNVPNLKSLRTMRVLRPLRSINAIPSMKRLIATLLQSIPRMGFLVVFVIYFLTIFSILGIQLFARDYYYRCRLTDFPITNPLDGLTSWPIDESQERLCGGFYQCNANTYCHSLKEFDLPLEIDNVPSWYFIDSGFFHFDNIGIAILSVFRVITLEGWTAFMYNYFDSSGIIAVLFFPLLVVIGTFFLLNLFLAVIMQTFSETNKIQMEKEEREKRKKEEELQKLLGRQKPHISKMLNVGKEKLKINGGVKNIGDAAVFLFDLNYLKALKEQEDKAEEEVLRRQREEDEREVQDMVDELDSERFMSAHKNDASSQNQPQGHAEQIDQEEQVLQQDEAPAADVGPSSTAPENKKTMAQQIKAFFLKICENKWFILSINLLIVANTICLGLDSYPVNELLQTHLDSVNVVFFVIFFLEMIIKLIGLGHMNYLRDNYNIFDAIIVVLSIVDVVISNTVTSESDVTQGKGAISAFRAFRLIRIFKLAKSWSKLQHLLSTITKSLGDISSFSILLFLLIYIYMLLGMEVFADQLKGPNGDQIEVNRTNFNTFFSSFIVVFTVLTGENWDQTMFQFARKYGYTAIFFFVSLVIIGVWIFLNLFLAILLDNFDDDVEAPESSEENLAIDSENLTSQKTSGNPTILNRIKLLWRRIVELIDENNGNTRTLEIHTEILEQTDKNDLTVQGSHHKRGIDSLNMLDGGGSYQHERKDEIVHGPNNSIGGLNDESLLSIRDTSSVKNSLLPQINEHRQHLAFHLDTIKEQEEEKTDNLVEYRFNTNNNQQQEQQLSSSNLGNNLCVGITQNELVPKFKRYKTTIDNKTQDKNSLADFTSTQDPTQGAFQHSGPTNQDSAPPRHNQGPLSNLCKSEGSRLKNSENKTSSIMPPPCKSGRPRSFALALAKSQDIPVSGTQFLVTAKSLNFTGKSLFLMKGDNPLRVLVGRLVNSRYFESFIMLLIAISSVLLALDNPLNDPESTLVQFLYYADFVLTVFFFLEALFKIIAYGFLLNGENSYMRNGWNIMDFIIVIFSVISLSLSGDKLNIVKILRLLRVLRPLRIISRNRGLKIGIQALIQAIPDIVNLVIIFLLFILVFAIIGVNYFKGTFYACSYGDINPPATNNTIITMYDCLNLGGAWENSDQNFDNVVEAIFGLFQISTTEGWIDVMNRGIDAIGIEMQPIVNYNMWASLFYISFIILSNFLMMNLFSGVVVSSFNREKDILHKNQLLTDNQKKWLEQKKLLLKAAPRKAGDESRAQGCRNGLDKFVHGPIFENFILICIVFNTITLGINWYSQSISVDNILDIINYSFSLVFILEAVLKIIALGFKKYFNDSGNIFDFVVVLISAGTSIASLILNFDFGASTTFIRALRISRLLKQFKLGKQIKILFDTLTVTIPSLTNIGGLLLLFLYIFSVLGVFLFAEVKLQSNLSVYANFQSVGMAFLTLFRCATGESWDYLMMDVMRQRSILFQCEDYQSFDYSKFEANNHETVACGSQAAGLLFFVSYILIVPMIFLSLFMAIILEGFEQTQNKESTLIKKEDIQNFVDKWAELDTEGTGYMRVIDLPKFLLGLGKPLGLDPFEYSEHEPEKIDDFFDELNIPTYHYFRDVQFWDVLIGLSKVCLARYMEEDEDHQSKKNDDSHLSIEDEMPSERQQENEVTHKIQRDQEQVFLMRVELEFERANVQVYDCLDVEEVRRREMIITKHYIKNQDQQFTTAHIKAARLILRYIQRFRERRKKRASRTNSKIKNDSGMSYYSKKSEWSASDSPDVHPRPLSKFAMNNRDVNMRIENQVQQREKSSFSAMLREYEDGSSSHAQNKQSPLDSLYDHPMASQGQEDSSSIAPFQINKKVSGHQLGPLKLKPNQHLAERVSPTTDLIHKNILSAETSQMNQAPNNTQKPAAASGLVPEIKINSGNGSTNIVSNVANSQRQK